MTRQCAYLLTSTFLFNDFLFGKRHVIDLQIMGKKLKGRGEHFFAILEIGKLKKCCFFH